MNPEIKRLAKSHKLLHSKIRKILLYRDPLGISENSDEYNDEASKIAAQLERLNEDLEVDNLVLEVFTNAFGKSINLERLKPIINDLIYIKKHQVRR